MKEKEYLSIVLYTYNHQEFIYDTLVRILNFLKRNFDNFEVIVVNDSSVDNTKILIKKFINENTQFNITLINLSYKHGLESSIGVGVDFSIGDFVIELDSPILTFDVKIIYDLFKKSSEGFDIVYLKPNKTRNFHSRIFYFLLNHFSNEKLVYDTEIGYILTRRAINEISNIKDKTVYRKILHNYSGYKKGYLTIVLDSEIRSSLNNSEKIKMASNIIFSFTNIGYKINIYLTFLFLIVFVFVGFYTIYQYLFNEKLVAGWTTLMLVISFGFTCVFIVLAIISTIFSIVLKEIRTAPKYIIESIDKN